jgi:hypothetical protein
VRSVRSPSNLYETIFEDLGCRLRYKLGYTDFVKPKKLNEINSVSGSLPRSERTKKSCKATLPVAGRDASARYLRCRYGESQQAGIGDAEPLIHLLCCNDVSVGR